MKDKRRFEEFEKKYKQGFFDEIHKRIPKQFELVDAIMRAAKDIGQSNFEIPNTCTTLNNKIVELTQRFEKAGISMFAAEIGDYKLLTKDFVGDSIMNDLFDKFELSLKKLDEYNIALTDISAKKNLELQVAENKTTLKKALLKIKNFFAPRKPLYYIFTEDDKNILNIPLQEYKELNSGIFNYNLEENLIESLMKSISGKCDYEGLMFRRYEGSTVPGLFKQNVIPDLKKLGLENLIPELQKALTEKYKKVLPDSEVCHVKDEDMHLFVPDFTSLYENKEEQKKEVFDSVAIDVNADIHNHTRSKKSKITIR